MTIQKWRMYTTIRNKLLNTGAIIFGGAVRDEIIHNMNAGQFYKEQNEYYKKYPNEPLKNTFDYNNVKISPHTIDRLLIPTDIDCFIFIEQLDELIKYFNRCFKTHIKRETDLAYFKEDLEQNMYKLHKIELTTKMHHKYYVFNIDVVTINVNKNDKNYILPLEHEFDVNSLLWSKEKGIYSLNYIKNSSATIHNTLILNNIYNNIATKTAVMSNEFLYNDLLIPNSSAIKDYRIKKLKNKGWTIKINFNIYNFYNSNDMEDTCIICLKNKNDFKHCVNFKNCNCKIFICLECINKEYAKIMKCPSCRSPIMITDYSHIYAKNELYMYETYII